MNKNKRPSLKELMKYIDQRDLREFEVQLIWHCPFCKLKKPSLVISCLDGIYHCMDCKKEGNTNDLLEKLKEKDCKIKKGGDEKK